MWGSRPAAAHLGLRPLRLRTRRQHGRGQAGRLRRTPSTCLEASYRSPGAEGGWGSEELVPGGLVGGGHHRPSRSRPRPSSGFTVVWGEADPDDGTPTAPSRVRSSDRAGAGARGGLPLWATPLTVADAPNDLVGAGLDVASGADGAQVAVWQQGGRMAAAARSGARRTVGVGGGCRRGGDPARPGHSPRSRTSGVPAVASGSGGAGTASAHAAFRDGGGHLERADLGPGAEGRGPPHRRRRRRRRQRAHRLPGPGRRLHRGLRRSGLRASRRSRSPGVAA